MKRVLGCLALIAGLVTAPRAGEARGLGVELWTDRGNDAVYQPGDVMEIRARVSDDAYLLVYEIDAEGAVRVLYPWRGSSGLVEGRRTYTVPPASQDVELVVQEPMGQGYVVAIASREPFERLPWYLRPYDPHAEGVGFYGDEEEEEGVTAEGRIVGDPFVAMERIRRRVLDRPDDAAGFASAYTSYYVHERVRYPRYLCNDCHRPNRWAWWDGFDPYYTECRVVTFRVHWGWYWGPAYWFGRTPYFVYVARPDCPPRWHYDHWYSSWDGWNRWTTLWPSSMRRYKSAPPPGYVPPDEWDRRDWRGSKDPKPRPPGLITAHEGGKTLPIGRNQRSQLEAGDPRVLRPGAGDRPIVRDPGAGERRGDRGAERGVERAPVREERPWYDRPRLDKPAERPLPRREDGGVERPREERAPVRDVRPSPRYERPRETPPAPRREERVERPREERPAPKPEKAPEAKRPEPPKQDPPRREPSGGGEAKERRRP